MINLIRTIRFILHWDFINYTAADTFLNYLENAECSIRCLFSVAKNSADFTFHFLDQNHSQCLREVALPFVQRVQEIEVNRQ